MLSAALFTILSVTGAVSAQTGLANSHYKSSLNMTIDPDSQSPQLRAQWCNGQTNTCDLLCGSDTNENNCVINTLKWDCLCTANNSVPGLQYYTQTMPTFICQALFEQCNAQNVGSQDGQEACTENIRDLCATHNPPKNAIVAGDSSSTTTSAPSSTATKAPSSTPKTNPGSGATSSTSSGYAAPTMAPIGNGVAAMAAFGMMAYLV